MSTDTAAGDGDGDGDGPMAGADGNPAPGTEAAPKPGTNGNPVPGAEAAAEPGTDGNPAPGTDGNPAPGTEAAAEPGADGGDDPVPGAGAGHRNNRQARPGGTSPPAVRVRDLTASYGHNVVFDGLRLTVPVAGAVCVTGENGSGKTTLLRCVAGLHAADSGAVSVFGRPAEPATEFWRLTASTVQTPSWYPGLTAREHVELVRLAHGADPAGDDGVVDRLFRKLGIEHLGDSVPLNLSSGQRQRLILALVFARPSRLLLLDEPEQRLDPAARLVLAGLLRDYLAGGGSALLASHDRSFAEAAGCEIHPMDSLVPAPRP